LGYGDGLVLEDVDLTIPEGAFVGIVGPSGAGKSTLLRVMEGSIRPTVGTVVRGPKGRAGSLRMGVVPQLETIDWNFPITVEEVVLLGLAADRRWQPWPSSSMHRSARDILERLGIGHLLHRHIRNLSGGQQQRAFIARALIRRPDLLLLDEPTTGVDIATRHDVLHLLHELNHDGIAIVLTTHDLNAVAAHLPSLVCLNRRVIASGTPKEVLEPSVLRRLYGAEMIVVERDGILLIGDVPSATRDEHARERHAQVPVAHFGEEAPPHEHGPERDHEHEPATRTPRTPR
jgi:ABC-type Mn2+/Zn2+ transport system ATPase subunit